MNYTLLNSRWRLLTLVFFIFVSQTWCMGEAQFTRHRESIEVLSSRNTLSRGRDVSNFRTILDLRQKVINLETSSKNMTSKVDNITVQTGQLVVKTDYLDSTVKNITDQIEIMSTQNNQLETTVSNMTVQMGRLTSRNSDLKFSLSNITNEMETMSAHDKQLEASMIQQSDIIEKLTEDLDSLKQVTSGHSDAIRDLEELANPDENLFILSNQTCGGVLIGQTGSIVFTNEILKDNPSSCIWTIRTNNRKTIKIALESKLRSNSYPTPNLYVVEILKGPSATSGNISTSTKLHIKKTKLEENIHYTFTGPVVFVVYDQTNYQDGQLETEVRLHFEGIGKLTEKNTLFSHEFFQQSSGTFSSSFTGTLERNLTEQNSENQRYVKEFNTIVISNFTSNVHWQANLENEACKDNASSFLVITDLLDNSITDCCTTSCATNNEMVNLQSPLVLIIEKKIETPLNFNLTWESDTVYPSSSIITTSGEHECGEILGGENGTLAYKPNLQYKNGERCIWTIVPQPFPRESIDIKVDINGLENVYDQLYMMELVDVNGSELEGGPKITGLGRNGTYTANSREVYIIFSSDMSIPGNGFSLSWMASGASIKTGKDVTTRFTFLRNTNGIATTLLERPTLANEVYHVFMLTPSTNLTNSHGMQLNINQNHPVQSSSCFDNGTRVYAAVDGIMTKQNIIESCSIENNSTNITIGDIEDMAIIVVNDRKSDSYVEMGFSWRVSDSSDNMTFVTVEDNKCGGVIKADKGILKYKFNQSYLDNEQCIWLLQTPNHTRITLKLLKDGFETCCDYISVTTIDPNTGKFRNDTAVINAQNRQRTFEDSVVVLVFQTDFSNQGKGFELQFVGHGQAEQAPAYKFELHHHNQPHSGYISFPGANWNTKIKTIYVSASNTNNYLTRPTLLNWRSGNFIKYNNGDSCTYDSVTYYTPSPRRWSEEKSLPNANAITSCQNNIAVAQSYTWLSSSFVVIYRHVGVDQQGVRTGFAYENYNPGSIIRGNPGVLSYAENTNYHDNARLEWFIYVPGSKRISLRLEKSGLERCCDKVNIYKTTQSLSYDLVGSMAYPGNTTVVDGPMAKIVFTSDGSATGLGFRLTFENYERRVTKSS